MKEHNEKERADSISKWYSKRCDVSPYIMDIVKILVKIYNPSYVLDIGCSTGYLLYAFRKFGVKDAVGVDISKVALSYFFEELKGRCIVCDIENEDLPFKDETFDLITILEVLEHLNNFTIISEMYRVLKSNGIVVMATPSNIVDFIRRVIGFLWTKKRVVPVDYPPHVNVHQMSFWIKEFDKCGFTYLKDMKKSYNKKLINSVAATFLPKEADIFLTRLGTWGKKIRIKLAYHLWSNTLLFKKNV